jgi:uncharacterized protein (TIGR03118 family)
LCGRALLAGGFCARQERSELTMQVMEERMKRKIDGRKAKKATARGLILITALVGLAVTAPLTRADQGNGNKGSGGMKRPDDYCQLNLVSDQAGVAILQDTNLVNAWGISFSPTSPFWVSDNGSGLATLYAVTNDALGVVHVDKQGLQVTIPGEGNPTGQLFDGTGSFHGDIFIFASEDGTISGWRGALGTAAEVLTNRSTAVYKGITRATNSSGPLLLAANFAEGTIDEYGPNGATLTLLGQFKDPKAPAGYAPFNVQNLNGVVFVTFAKQDEKKHDDVPGTGHGLIDTFNPQTGMFHRLVTGKDAGGKLKEISSPWGMALSPSTFGRHADQLLVGNFGSGTIMAFEPNGEFDGLLESCGKGPVTIDGLWGLTFGNVGRAGTPDVLFFSAGPNHEADGLFGSLTLQQDFDSDDQEQGHGHHQ